MNGIVIAPAKCNRDGRVNMTTQRKSAAATDENTVYVIVVQVLLIAVILLGVSGSFLLMLLLVLIRKQKLLVDKLIFNMAVCNLCLILIAVPPQLMEMNTKSFVFGKIGCKIIYPCSSYFVSASTMTLLLIAFERLNAVRKLFISSPKLAHIVGVFLSIHVLSLCQVIPYATILYYDEESKSCNESWSLQSRKVYAVCLFLLQYGLPVVLMTYCYTSAWFAIGRATKKLITSVKVERQSQDHIHDFSASFKRTSAIENTNKSESSTVEKETVPKPIQEFIQWVEATHIPLRKISRFQSTISLPFIAEKSAEYGDSASEKESIPQQRCEVHTNAPDPLTSSMHNRCVEKNAMRVSIQTQTRKLSDRTTRLFSEHIANRQIFCRISRNLSLMPITKKNLLKEDLLQTKALEKRLRQTHDLLQMFSFVVLIFIIFMLPNQVLWLFIDFKEDGNEFFDPLVYNLVYILTHANCVLSPLVYGRISRSFKKSFNKLFEKFGRKMRTCRSNLKP